MNKLHRDIDKIDEKLFKLLKSRFDKAKKIGQVKKFLKDPITNEDREKVILEKIKSPDYEMYQDELNEVYKVIFEQMKKIQQKVEE